MQKIDFKGVVYSRHLMNPILGVAQTETHWLCGIITGDMKDLWEGYPEIHKYPTVEEYLDDLIIFKPKNEPAYNYTPCSYGEACQRILDSLPPGNTYKWKVNETTLEFDLTESITKLKKGVTNTKSYESRN